MWDLELKIPPPAIAIACGVLAWLIAPLAATRFVLHGLVGTILAIALAVLSFALAAAAMLAFRRAQTTINPTKPDTASSLVTRGVFRFTRNPMYLALLLLLSAWVVYLGNIVGVAVLLLFVAYITRYQIRPEERVLAAKFEEAYTSYRGQVRRWI